VLKVARDEGVIDALPSTPRTRQKDNPRAFFRFHPLVPKERDTYKKLLDTAKKMAAEHLTIRGVTVTDEMHDMILFVTHSFVRPTITELYAIRHSDVQVAEGPKRLLVTIRNGKTGYRTANTMPGAVSVYDRMRSSIHFIIERNSSWLCQFEQFFCHSAILRFRSKRAYCRACRSTSTMKNRR
jgi:hypothetical protein